VLTQPRGKSYSCRCNRIWDEGYRKIGETRYSSFVLAQFLGHLMSLEG
jgi:hypothetical protein